MTVIEKILSAHSGRQKVAPGEIIDVEIDARVARDFGGANVIKNLLDNNLPVDDPEKTFFTFDCNPTGSDQKYAANQHLCRLFARERGIRVYDIDRGIGTHLLIEEGLAYPGSTAVSTDSHANILGAVGAFGQGMGDKDIAAAWYKGKIWFKVPESVKIVLLGRPDSRVTAKDLVLNLLEIFGPGKLLGYSVELEGDYVDSLTLDQRITIASMATEMGAIIIFFPPNLEVIRYCESRAMKKIDPVFADADAGYAMVYHIDIKGFIPRIARPGKPHDTDAIPTDRIWIDSAFIGSCTNGRIEDLRAAASILKGKKVAHGVVLKVVPSTDRVWEQCLEEGLVEIFKESGALLSNAGCAGCAAGQVGQNGPGEVTISTGNRNFPGKQGQGDVYLASPVTVAASAVAGYITDPYRIPEKPPAREFIVRKEKVKQPGILEAKAKDPRPVEVTGRVWYIDRDNIDTDMIYHNKYLTVTDIGEMGRYAFDNLDGYRDFSAKVRPGDIIVTGKNFGSGSSRQQAVDCFISLGICCIVAESIGAIYERNAINAGFPVVISDQISQLKLSDGDMLSVNFMTGTITNLREKISIQTTPFSDVQMEIYQNNGLF